MGSGVDPEELAPLHRTALKLGIANQVLVLPDVDDGTTLLLYQACQAFVFASLDDCLGLPVIRAMRCGAPTIVSDLGLLHEIVRDPAARFDPTHETSVATALERALTDEPFLESRLEAGSHDVGRYSWDAWEENVWAAYDFAARRRP
jgi:glycosyltransferase involved in cell wall biosynthesis